MAGEDALDRFVREALAAQVPRARIEAALGAAGWRSEDVRRALDEYVESDLPVPVPRPRPYVSAKDAFLYLVLFAMLYVSAYHLGQLVFRLIDLAWPEPADAVYGPTYARDAIRWAVSSIVIAFPIFLFVSRLIDRSIRADPAARASRVRKWLTYMTLFLAASVLVGDLTTLVYSALGGELGLRFLLKVLTVGAIAGAIFGYYLSDLRRDDEAVRA